jgi:phage shock protein PspC (stress-responsive transcriptional regulator)
MKYIFGFISVVLFLFVILPFYIVAYLSLPKGER